MTITDPDIPAVFADFDVCCHTEGCDNAGSIIRVKAVVGSPTIMCGSCNSTITDITAVAA